MCIIRESQSMEYMEVAKQTSYALVVDDTQRLPRNVRLAHATSWQAVT